MAAKIRKLYPGGRPKAFNITYDDGVLQDVRFVRLLNRYGLKGTFNLNSQLMQEEFEWVHEKGLTIKRLSAEKAVKLYAGHEIASHTLTHPYMENLPEEEITRQMQQDKENLQQIFGRPVTGFAVPFSYYSPLIAYCATKRGFEYARCSAERYTYSPPANYYWWAAGAYHINPRWRKFADEFFLSDTELALCQIVGHSYDLDTENMWQEMESLLQRVARDATVATMTNRQLVRYLKAVRQVNTNSKIIRNTTDTDLWYEINGKTVRIPAGGEYHI